MRCTVGLILAVAAGVVLSGRNFAEAGYYQIQNRIAGGESAEDGQFPYQARIRVYTPIFGVGYTTASCGGALIARNLVLTAAHCVIRVAAVEVHLGAVDFAKEEPNRQVYEVSPEYIIIHERYEVSTARNDIAIINIPQYVNFNDNIQPVNLPRRSQRWTSFDRYMGWISGWGSLGDGKGSPTKLQYAQRWILTAEFCELQYKHYQKETQICLDGSYKISACRGDSGGPLTIVEEDGTKTLVGLTSYGKPGGCERNFPVVFTRITAYLDWIVQRTGINLLRSNYQPGCHNK